MFSILGCGASYKPLFKMFEMLTLANKYVYTLETLKCIKLKIDFIVTDGVKKQIRNQNTVLHSY